MRRLFVFLSIAALLALVAAPAFADGGGAKNVVLALNYSDDFEVARSGLLVSSVGADNIGSENLASATSSCVGCRTVAAAMQVVLITSNASVIAPTNAAVAFNGGCDSCETFAFAYQYVITTGGPVYLTAAGQLEVQRIRAEVAAVAASDLALPDLAARLDALYEELKATINAELVHPGALVGTTTQKQISTG